MKNNRREHILDILAVADKPTSASSLASKFGVSRQIIVGDVSLLRAEGNDITSTPRGYVMDKTATSDDFGYTGLIVCKHNRDGLTSELYTVADYGGTVIDVVVEHPFYGELKGSLDISSRYEADLFMNELDSHKSEPLSSLTDGIHIHHVGCRDKDTFQLICTKLDELGITYTDK